MHADGHAGFENLYRSSGIRDVACTAHIRRSSSTCTAQGSSIAEKVIARIGRVDALEKTVRCSSLDPRVEIRQATASTVFDDLEGWSAEQLHRHLQQDTPRCGDPSRADRMAV